MKTEYTVIPNSTTGAITIVCRVDPDAPRPLFDAGSPEMAILVEKALNAYEDLPEPEDFGSQVDEFYFQAWSRLKENQDPNHTIQKASHHRGKAIGSWTRMRFIFVRKVTMKLKP